jgi:signal transduction histidine kinase
MDRDGRRPGDRASADPPVLFRDAELPVACHMLRGLVKPLRVLMLDDSEEDVRLVARELSRGGYAPDVTRVERPEALRAALAAGEFDVMIAAWGLPAMGGLEALRLVHEAAPELPFVIVAGALDEQAAAEALRRGAGDFVTKDNLARLVPAVRREIADAQVRRERGEAFAALREAVVARDAFLSIASHELKTPLTSLQLQVEALTRAVEAGAAGTPRLSQRIAVVARSADRLGELVNRLLDVSRISSAQGLDLVTEDVDLAEVAREVVGRFHEALAETGSELRLDAPAPVRGVWDRGRVDTIVTNLVSNAVKYGEGRPIEVSVGVEVDRAVLRVRDHGIGIAPEDQARIFERFERAVPERHYGGFGVGLWVARSIAEAHAGRILVESRPGAGSLFTLELPRARGGPA